jgi:hypothetical protein
MESGLQHLPQHLTHAALVCGTAPACVCALYPQVVAELEALHSTAADELSALYEARLALEAERAAQVWAWWGWCMCMCMGGNHVGETRG